MILALLCIALACVLCVLLGIAIGSRSRRDHDAGLEPIDSDLLHDPWP